jgi:hypothetical protein
MGALHRVERVAIALERRVGYVGDLITTGRRSGRPRGVTVGFVRDDDGTTLVAAQRADSAWARNLSTDPRCVADKPRLSLEPHVEDPSRLRTASRP